MHKGRIIIIGGGIAGVSAAHAARSEYPEAGIEILSAEPFPLYNRIALNSYITGRKRRDHLGFFPMGALAEKHIGFRSGCTVTDIDSDRRFVTLDTGESLSWDSLILATGAESSLPSIKGIDSDGVYPLWSLKDAMDIKAAMNGAGNVFVLGAGVLGVEIAMDLASAGKKVVLAGSRERVLPRILDEVNAAVYRKAMENAGVSLHLPLEVIEVRQQPKGLTIHTSSGDKFGADALLVLTGARPVVDLARASAVDCAAGILVDEYMRTGTPGILACGNCTESPVERGLLWNPAQRQGETAGRNAFAVRRTVNPDVETIHIKTPEIPAFACGPRGPEAPGDMVLTDSGKDYNRCIFLNARGEMKTATFVGMVHGAYAVEQAIRRKTVIPEELRDSGNIDALIEWLESPRLTELYPGRAWVCRMCGYIYEGDDPPEICPVCSVGKDQFQAA